MSFPVRLDEADKTASQLDQRDKTYAAAAMLKANDISCEVIEYFTGNNKTANAAAIILTMENIDE